MNRRFLIRATVALVFAGTVPALGDDAGRFDTGLIPSPRILLPSSAPDGAVVLLSDAGGWTADDDRTASALVDGGAAVIGIDLPAYIHSLENDRHDCIYTVSDIEALSQQVQRAGKSNVYRPPVVAGIGEGGTMALAIAAQTPAATIGGTVAIDPKADVRLPKVLCTPAIKENTPNGVIYGLSEGTLPDSVIAGFSPNADAAGQAHVERLKREHDDIEIRASEDDARTILNDTLDELMSAGEPDNPLGLPITVLDASPTRNTMAIIYSGDGGWRDLDKEVGGLLQENGIPVVGIDSLRYFWSGRSPQETAGDLARIIDVYRKRWKVQDVVLIGYSFGADVLPAVYRNLPEAEKASVALVSLLGLSHKADFKISVLGWLGAEGEGAQGDPVDDVKAMDPRLVQCVYGTDDEDACADIKDSGVEAIALEGGHHFDGDYKALTARILEGLGRRLAER